MRTSQILKVALFMATAALLSACGASKKSLNSSIDLSSRSPLSEAIPQSDSYALCNLGELQTLKAKLMIYVDAQGNYRNEAVRVAFSDVSSEFATSNLVIRAFRWKSNDSGEVYMDSNPLALRIENLASKSAETGYLTEAGLSWGLAKDALTMNSVQVKDSAELFSKHSFVVDLKEVDPENPEFEVLKIAIYKDNQMIEQTDILIPAFKAHPGEYASQKPTILSQLHPFIGESSSSWEPSHYSSRFNDFCF